MKGESKFMNKTALVVMAAGIGSRFGGGIKQLEPVGPNGEILMDYSIKDALDAGFDRVIFIIRKDLEAEFKKLIGKRIEKMADIAYAFQELEDLPENFKGRFLNRTKPWGTGQAVLSLRGMINEPFAVINADDYYGKEAFVKLHGYLSEKMDVKAEHLDLCMAGFTLSNTLSENGGVTRGVCRISENGKLLSVQETYELKKSNNMIQGFAVENGIRKPVMVDPGVCVSMNMWGLPPSFIGKLEEGFSRFLSELLPDDRSSEYLLPQIIDRFLKEDKADVEVLMSGDKWFGMTYKEDVEIVKKALANL